MISRRMLCLSLFAATTSVVLWATHGSVTGLGLFELDGNYDDVATTGDDWSTLNPPPAPNGAPGGSLRRTFVTDGVNATIFTGGQSKDFEQIHAPNGTNNWKNKDGSVPPKDEIAHAYASAYISAGELILYFGADREAVNGSANIGFWFFKQTVAPDGSGGFTGNHEIGDILIISEFTTGGKVSTVRVFEWNPPLATEPEGNLRKLFDVTTSTTADCLDVNVDPRACAVVNAGSITTELGTFAAGAFFEGGVNLSRLLGANNVGCFTSFLAETRSSHEVNATLKDFVGGNFQLCSIAITKACAGSAIINNGTQIRYDFTGTVTNNGVGKLFDVVVADTFPGNPGEVIIPVVAELLPGASAPWQASFISTSIEVTNSAEARAASNDNGDPTVRSDPDAQIPCNRIPRSIIGISKVCGIPASGQNPAKPGTELVVESGRVVVQVNFSGQVCNNGETRITGITAVDEPIATLTGVPAALNPGQCQGYSGTYRPASISANGNIPGRYLFSDLMKITAATSALDPPLTPIASGQCSGTFGCAPASCSICPLGTCQLQ